MSELDNLEIDTEYRDGLNLALIKALFNYRVVNGSAIIRTGELYQCCAMLAAHLFVVTKSQGSHNISSKEFSEWMAKRIRSYIRVCQDHPELADMYQSLRVDEGLH